MHRNAEDVSKPSDAAQNFYAKRAPHEAPFDGPHDSQMLVVQKLWYLCAQEGFGASAESFPAKQRPPSHLHPRLISITSFHESP
jgi:hypothetical protein